jgi:hypothetical protein
MTVLTASLTISQFVPRAGNSSGRLALMVVLAGLLAGGIYLLVHSVIDFRKDRKAVKRDEEMDRKKAA